MTGAWYEVAAVELQSSISDAAVSAGPEPFLQLSKGAELLEAGRVVWQKKAFTGVSLQLRPEAVARLSTLNDRDLFIGIGDSLEGARIGMVLWAEENGSVGVAGTCDDDNVAAFLMGFAASQPTKETAEILLELVQDPDNASKQLSDWRYPEAVAWQDRDPSVRQIDPDYTPLEILGALTMVGIDVDVPKEWRTGLVLCTRTRLAWNDCWTLSDDEGPVPVFLLAYVDEVSHSALEFWILDEDVNLAEPLLKLGEVPLEAGTSNLAVRIDPQAGKSLDSLVAEGQHLDAISLVNR